MVDDEREEKKEKAFFKKTAKEASQLAREHKKYGRGGGVSATNMNENMAKYGRGLTKAMMYGFKKAGRGR